MDSSSLSQLSDSHRHFNQALMIQRVLMKRDAEMLVKDVQRLYEEEVVPFHEFVGVVNEELDPLGLKVAMGRMEQDGSEWVGLVNTVIDPAAKKATLMSLPNLEYFRNCLQLITQDDTGTISSSILLRSVDSLQRKMTKRAAQDFLESLVNDKWLTKSDGYFSLGPRCVLELLPFLPEITGQPVDECHLCSNHVVMGQRCDNCNEKLHLYCLARLAETRDQVKCPQCHSEWEQDIPDLVTHDN